MFKFDWDAVRAYASLCILTIVALYAIWKDAHEYKKRAYEERVRGFLGIPKRNAVTILYAGTLAVAVFGAMDIHSTRHQAIQDKSDAKAQDSANEKQIQDLQANVKAGNELLGQQRQDFLKQFSEMSDRVTELQTSIKTADLQEEAVQLRSDLEATRKSMEVSKATLSFSFWEDSAETSSLVTLNMEDGVVKVPFTIMNGTDVDALDGTIVIFACDACKIVDTSPGFTKMDGQADNQRNFDFQHIFANSRAPKLEVSIVPPPNATTLQVAIEYRCRTCTLVKSHSAFPRNDVGTVLIGPHWRPSMLPQKGISPTPK
jgi:hypothetical protein